MKKDRKLKRKKSKIIKVKSLLNTKKEKKYKTKKFKIKLPFSQISKIDEKYNIETFSIFCELDNNEYNQRIKKLNKLQDLYVNLLNKILYNGKDKESLMLRGAIKDVLNYISNRIVFEKDNNIKKEKPVLKEKIVLKEKNNLKEKNKDYPTDGIIDTFKNKIRNNQITNNLIDESYDIISSIRDKSDNIIIINSILDLLKNKKYDYNKIDNEYLIIKQVRDIFKKYKKMINYNKSDDFIDAADIQRYNIIFSLLFNEKDYYVVKSLLEDLENFVNIRIDDKHIVCYILDVYLKYLEELLNKNFNISNKINVDYIYEIYLLYINNKKLKLKRSDIEYINNKINIFINRITDEENKKKVTYIDEEFNTILIKKESKKESILKRLNGLIPYTETKKELKYRKFKDYELETQIKYFLNNKCFSNSYNDLTEKENIIITNSFVCYGYNKESKVLKVSIPDISLLIDEDTPLDSYLYNKTIKRERIDERILEKLIYKENEKMPSITFKILLDKNNNPANLYIYKSKIIPKKYSNTKTYSDLKDDFGSLIEEQVDNVLNISYLKYVNDNNLPFIYSGNEEIEQFDYDTFVNVSSMSQIFSDEEYNKIYKVLTNTTRSFHYSNKKFKSNNFNMNLTRPNYMTLLNIRIIKKLVFNTFNATDFINEEIKELVDNLNTSLEYKDTRKLFKKLIKK